MNRLVGIAAAMLLAFITLVPVVAAAEPLPWARAEQLIIVSGTDVTLAAGQSVDVVLVVNGHARIEGSARTIFVFGGTADLVGARTSGIVAFQAGVSIDGASIVAGDIRSLDSTIVGASAATVTGRIRDIGPDMALGWLGIGSVLVLIYIAFAISVLVAGVAAAGLAGRQVRAATALIGNEPVQVLGAGVLGLIGLLVGSVVALVTVIGIPLGLGLLVLVLPALFVAGYIVAGIWLGEQLVGRTSAGIDRERPYRAAIVGLAITGVVSIVPGIGALISFVGLGAIVLLMWRIVHRDRVMTASGEGTRQIATAAS